MGHSSIRVTQEIYVHVCADVYDRFLDATDRPLPDVSDPGQTNAVLS
jgi:hypothetical protein